MSRPVYSSQLWVCILTGGDDKTFTVPDGFRAVIRDVSGTIFTAGSGGAELLVVLNTSGATVIHSRFPPGYTGGYHWEGHIVVEPGDSWTASNGLTDETDLVFSGYLLTLP